MPKTVLTPGQQFDLRQALHIATLEALLASRRWQPGELVFQGGTSLHLAHGSPRFSEDLDFLVLSTLKLDMIGKAIEARVAPSPWVPKGMKVIVTKAKEHRNPHAFDVTLTGPNVVGSVRVKVELWQVSREAIAPLQIVVSTIRLGSGPAAGVQVFVPTASLAEVYADKVFAIAARPYFKPRDVFDLHYIRQHAPDQHVSARDLEVRLLTYPNATPAGWLQSARQRADELPGQVGKVLADLLRWLPSSWPLDSAVAASMIETSVAALREGIEVMETIAADRASHSARPKAPAAEGEVNKPEATHDGAQRARDGK